MAQQVRLNPGTTHRRAMVAIVLGIASLGAAGYAQLSDELVDLAQPAIAYAEPAVKNTVARLNDRLASGQARFRWDEGSGYLKSVLETLDVPVESQIALFSRGSLQRELINPQNPRTIFFNDSVAVAWVRGGFIEIAAHDGDKGAVFFKLMQTPGLPRFFRDNTCLGCHYSGTTMGVPGFISRSVPSATDGTLMPWLGNYLVDHRTPISDRWGGMYVTGRTGSSRHLGNAPIANKRLQEIRASDAGPILDTLGGRFDSDAYVSPHSDIVALLVFEHQMHMMNLLSRIGADARILAQGPTGTAPLESGRLKAAPTSARLQAAAVEVVDYMLFVDEAPLTGASGTSGFAKVFSAKGPRDGRGRSLRDLDLQRRLMRYPCSYLIYSEAFDALPPTAKDVIYRRMKQVLTGEATGAKYARLTGPDRRAVLEILRETKRDFSR